MIDIADRLELFVDDALVETMSGCSLQLHHPTAREIVLEHDRPWEGNACGYHTIFRDGDRFRMTYKAWQLETGGGKLEHGHPFVTGYAESSDGIHWEKPRLGLFEFDGSKDNNIIWTGTVSHNFCPFKDGNPHTAPDATYKALGSEGEKDKRGLHPFKSSDCIHWERLQEGPVITDGAFDSQNLAFWDAVRGEYRAYYRDFYEADGKRYRGIKTATSPDFLTWTEGTWLRYTGVPDEQLYTNQVAPYCRAPHLFIGFPARYVERRPWSPAIEALPEVEHRRRRSACGERYGTAVTDTVFMTSRDGKTFRRWGEAFIRPGLRPIDSWVYGDMYVGWHLVETASDIPGAPDELSLYATESYFRGTSNRLRRYTLRTDGFVSIAAPLSGGEMLTKPLTFKGSRLHLNVSASAAGSVRVEVQDAASGTPLPGFALNDCIEILGDDLDRAVSWSGKDDLNAVAGKPVRLRFVLHDADLFSMRFGND